VFFFQNFEVLLDARRIQSSKLACLFEAFATDNESESELKAWDPHLSLVLFHQHNFAKRGFSP